MEKRQRIHGRDVVFILGISLIGGILRFILRNDISGDYRAFLQPWYETIQQLGGKALGVQVGDYNLPYQTFILMMTYLPLKPLYAYKLVSCIFDYLLAMLAGKLAGILGGTRYGQIALYGAVLLFPQVWIDSAHWAQCDAIYTFWLLVCVSLYLKERYSAAFFVFGVALSFKLQAIFIVPFFLMAWLLWDRHRFWKFLWILPGFYAFCVPAILGGRKLTDPFGIYLNQTTEYSAIRFNFPSFWGMLFPAGTHSDWNKAAILLTLSVLAAGLWRMLSVRMGQKTAGGMTASKEAEPEKSLPLGRNLMLRLCIWCIWTCVLFLPNMHERYAYSLDILMLVFLFTINSGEKEIPVIGICWLSSLVCYGTARLELPYSVDLFRLTCGLYFAAYLLQSRMLFMKQARVHTSGAEETQGS